jgi:hypothetical protein
MEGEKTSTCSVCKATSSVKIPIDTKAHMMQKTKVVQPTFKAGGYTLMKCKECGKEEKTDLKPALSNNPARSEAAEAVVERNESTGTRQYTDEGYGALAITDSGRLIDISGAYQKKSSGGQPVLCVQSGSGNAKDVGSVNIVKTSGMSSGAKALLNKAHSIMKSLEGGWTYKSGSSGATLSKAKKNGKKADCARYVSYSMQSAGMLKSGETFHTSDHGKLKNDDGKPISDPEDKKTSSPLANNKNIQRIWINDYGKNALANGKLKSGDVVCMAQHTMMYDGYITVSGKKTLAWYSAGVESCTQKKGKPDKFKWIHQSNSRYDDKVKILFVLRAKK